jgi:hypothetical protein
MASGSELLANSLLPALVAGRNFNFPLINLTDPLFQQPSATGESYLPIDKLETEDLTTGQVGGSGVFDLLMTSLKAHLKEEYSSNRLSGAEYSKAYVGVVGAALQTSAQFLLGKDQAYWQALLVQKQARLAEIEGVKARLELETARLQLVRAQFEAATTEANYALTKLKLATEDATYGNLLAQGVGISFTNAQILPLQKTLLQEQIEVQRAQTLDTRADGATIVGSIGKQKALYEQQITSYKRDAETKAVKMFTDAWITQKTIDEGLLAPTNFQNTSIDQVLTALRTNLTI